MGDRALIQMFSSADSEFSPVLYLHWGGAVVGDILRKAQEQMKGRPNDVSYAFARLTQCACEDDGNTGVGVFQSAPLRATDSNGDAGVFVVDVSAEEWKVYIGGGYGFTSDEDDDSRQNEHGLKVHLLDVLECRDSYPTATAYQLEALLDALNEKVGGVLYGQDWRNAAARRHELAVLLADALDVVQPEHEDDDTQARLQGAAERISLILREALPVPTEQTE